MATGYQRKSIAEIMRYFNIDRVAASLVRQQMQRTERMKNYHEIKLETISRIVGGYGVEVIFLSDPEWPDLMYVNMGDTYQGTIVYNAVDDKYRYTSWGDELERLESRLVREGW